MSVHDRQPGELVSAKTEQTIGGAPSSPMEGCYEYDVFLSYCRRSGSAAEWVTEYFAQLLEKFLGDLLPDRPRIYLDAQMETGERWPDHLRRGLSRSKLMIAVWNAPYFSSPWCLAEWYSMQERERMCSHAGPTNPAGLVIPLHYADGNHFDAEARTRIKTNVQKWCRVSPAFAQSADFLTFEECIRRLAELVTQRLEWVPPWQDWPVRIPDPASVPPAPAATDPKSWLGGA